MTVTDLDARRSTGMEELPPHDIDAEQIVVGAAILDRRALSDIAEIITPADLFRPAHQTILQTVMDMADDGKPLGAVAVAAELERRGASRATGGGVYLHTLTDAVPSVANAGYYARIVADLAGRRRIAEAGARIHQLGMSAEGEAGEVAERAVEALAQAMVDGSQHDGDTEAIGDDAEFIDRLAAPVDTSRAVPAPYAELEDLLGGMKNGQLITVAGRTGAGKSVVGLDIARHTAIRLGMPVLYASMEMPQELVRQRVYAAQAKVALTAITHHALTERDWGALAAARPAIAEAPLYISTPPSCTLGLVRSRLQAMERRGRAARLLVVDHVGLMSSTGRTESRYNEVSEFARGLKLIAMGFDIPVVMLCQVNRAAGNRADAIPRLSDLRDSGELEQSSDVVLVVHRPDYEVTEKEHARAGEVDLYVAKNRSGPQAVVTLSSQLHYARFVDMAQG